MIDYLVRTNGLRPGDAIVAKKEPFGLFSHYVVYLGYYYGGHKFIANYTLGIKILSEADMSTFASYMVPTRIKRFQGNEIQRQAAVQRALSRVDEESYNLLFNNCEHFSNFVQTGQSYSGQTKVLGASLTAAGLITATNARNDDDRGAGLFVAGLGLLTLLIDQNR